MDSVIQLSFRYREADFIRAARANILSTNRLWLDTAAAAICFGLGIAFWGSADLKLLSVLCLAVTVCWALVTITGLFILPRLAFRRQPRLRDECHLKFSPAGIHFKTAIVDSRLDWGLYSKALIDPHSIILYYGKRQFSLIPTRVFLNVDQQQGFEALLASKVPQIIRRKS